MNLLSCATLTVADAAASADRFVTWFDYRLVEAGMVSRDLAESWGTPASSDRPCRLCQPASGADVYVRLIEGDPVAGYAPLRSVGWAAIEICVQDVVAVHRRMIASPFEVIGPPKPLSGFPTIQPMQVRGPDGEIIYLTQMLSDDPEHGLPIARAPIDKLFILVLACADMAQTALWFAGALRLDIADPVAIRYSMLAKAFDLPIEQLHELTTASWQNDIFLEFDQYPDAAIPRPAAAGALPPGVAICSLVHPDFDRLEVAWLTPPAARTGPLYRDRLVGVLKTPEGALLEIIDGSSSTN